MRTSLAQLAIALSLGILAPSFTTTVCAHTNSVAAELDAAREHLVDEVRPATYFIFREFTVEQPNNRGTAGPFRSLGSGFGVTKEGLIITNAHVVIPRHPEMPPPTNYGNGKFLFQDGSIATVKLTAMDSVGNEYPVAIVAVDGNIDLSLLSIQKPNEHKVFPVVEWATDSKDGDAVISIGSPFGVRNTIGDGIISETYVDPDNNVEYVRSNAMTHPGNSGGPLVRLRDHKVVGLNAMTLEPNGDNPNMRPFGVGIGFAISAKTCLKFIEDAQRQDP